MSDKLPRPNVITGQWINRNKRRLVTNIKELNRQLSDIENSYNDFSEITESDAELYNELYSDYEKYNNQLTELKEIERTYCGNN